MDSPIIPAKLKFQYCYDGLHFPEMFVPAVCVMRIRESSGAIVGKFQVCTPIHDPSTPDDKFWIVHNSISRERARPFAYLVTSEKTNTEFLEAVSKFKELTFNLKTPY